MAMTMMISDSGDDGDGDGDVDDNGDSSGTRKSLLDIPRSSWDLLMSSDGIQGGRGAPRTANRTLALPSNSNII